MATIFDASVLNDNENKQLITKDQLVSELVPKIERILKDRFPTSIQRQKVRIYRDRIAFAAPCCGDSARNDFKKRGNIILTGKYANMYKCHNCGAFMSIPKFFKRYGEEISLDAIDYITANKVETEKVSMADATANVLYDLDRINQFAINRDFFRNLLQLEECSIPNEAHMYLVRRHQYDFVKFLFQPRYRILFVLNVTPSGDIFGMQVHHMDPMYKGPKYKTYSLQKIHSELLHDDVQVPEDLDTLSMIFNILLVNYAKPVTILEGPMDSFLVNNSIALLGAGKHIDFYFQYRFMFDDDKTGREHALEKLTEGYEVFMWDKYKRDMGMPQRKKWDMNDVVLWTSQTGTKQIPIDDYFTDNDLDMMDI